MTQPATPPARITRRQRIMLWAAAIVALAVQAPPGQPAARAHGTRHGPARPPAGDS